MDIFLKVTLVVTGVSLVVFSTGTTTKGTLGILIFKTIPMLLGIACIVSALYVFGVLR